MCFAAAHLQARGILATDQMILSPQPLTSDTWEHYADGTRCRLHTPFLACLAPGGNPARLFKAIPANRKIERRPIDNGRTRFPSCGRLCRRRAGERDLWPQNSVQSSATAALPCTTAAGRRTGTCRCATGAGATTRRIAPAAACNCPIC